MIILVYNINTRCHHIFFLSILAFLFVTNTYILVQKIVLSFLLSHRRFFLCLLPRIKTSTRVILYQCMISQDLKLLSLGKKKKNKFFFSRDRTSFKSFHQSSITRDNRINYLFFVIFCASMSIIFECTFLLTGRNCQNFEVISIFIPHEAFANKIICFIASQFSKINFVGSHVDEQ